MGDASVNTCLEKGYRFLDAFPDIFPQDYSPVLGVGKTYFQGWLLVRYYSAHPSSLSHSLSSKLSAHQMRKPQQVASWTRFYRGSHAWGTYFPTTFVTTDCLSSLVGKSLEKAIESRL